VSETPGPSTGALFTAFLTIGLSGFGGVLPFARRTLVDRRGWLTPDDFNETLSLCQSLPGPNVVNLSIVVGGRARGWPGSIAALLGLVGAPFLIVIGFGAFYSAFGSQPAAKGMLTGLGAAASGLVAATAARMAEPLARRRPWLNLPFAIAAFAAVALAQLPLPGVLVVLAPISVVLAWALGRRRA
jgi:chromate transporter